MSPDLPGMPGPEDLALDHLFRALTADGSADELADRDAALTMFRDSRRRFRRRHRFASSMSMAATVIVITGGMAAAAYATALPAPVQHVAHRLLDRIGVPDAHHPSASSSAHGIAAPTPSAASAPAIAACPCQAGQPGADAAPNLVLAASHAEIPANGDDVLSGRLAHGGQPEPGVRVQLFEHVDGRPGWRVAGSARTDRDGDVTLAVRHLTSNASFRLAAPDDGTRSTAVLITVIPPVYLHLAPGGRPGTDILTARAPFADSGDAVVLQARAGTVWYRIGEQVLNRDHTASFTVLIPLSGDSDFRVVVPRTTAHGSAVCGQVRITAHLSRCGGCVDKAGLGRRGARQARPAASPAAMRG